MIEINASNKSAARDNPHGAYGGVDRRGEFEMKITITISIRFFGCKASFTLTF
jgi:hypothetical protein